MTSSASGVTLRPVGDADLPMLERFAVEPGLIGPDWRGFTDARAPARRLAADGYLGPDGGRLVVLADGEAAGFVSWCAVSAPGAVRPWEIGIALLPEHRGHGVGWRAQALLAGYLFRHTPVQRIQAATQLENRPEQRALEKAGFQREGVLRACEFRDGAWRDGVLFSRLRSDPAPEIGPEIGPEIAPASEQDGGSVP